MRGGSGREGGGIQGGGGDTREEGEPKVCGEEKEGGGGITPWHISPANAVFSSSIKSLACTLYSHPRGKQNNGYETKFGEENERIKRRGGSA